ncbi:MAG: hypothetical protein H0T51_26725 [Pirellulales bacterium]|nr:hypothetical protein [Pirellulales bacterium]
MVRRLNLRCLLGTGSRWFVLSTVVFASAATSGRHTNAASELLAVTGQLQPGSSSIQLLGVSASTLNEAGEVAFRATLKQGVGLVDATNDRAVWRIDGAVRRLIAQTGVGDVPGGGSFDAFQAISIGDAGEVVIRATATSGRAGIWRYPTAPAAGSPIATTGVIGVPGVPTAQYGSIGFPLLHAPDNVVAYDGQLAHGIGGVTSSNDRGAWIDVAGVQAQIAREQTTPPPGVPEGQYQVPVAMAVNNQAQVAMLGTLMVNGTSITSLNAFGMWRQSAGGGELVARRYFGGVAELPLASFSAFLEPTINSGGQMAFAAELEIEGAVTAANNRGVWLHEGASGEILLRSGAAAPDVGGASLAAFESPLLNDAGQALIPATLVEGSGGVNSQNSHGLWVVEPGGGALLARTGSAGVPGVPGAHFAIFGALAFNESGVAAVQASLADVAPGTDQGLWLLDGTASSVLVARTGDVVGSRTIASLEFTGGSGGGDGRQRALNSNGQLVYKATFTNGDEGLFLYSPTVASSADFTLDGIVNGADLLEWRNGFGLAL